MRTSLIAFVAVLAAFGLASPALAGPGSAPAALHAGIKPPRSSGKTSGGTLTVHTSGSTGVVSPNPKVYLVFWGSQWSNDPAGAAPALRNLFSGLYGSADTWGTILDQYCEGVASGTSTCGPAAIHVQHPTSSILGGVWFDNVTQAPSSATTNQLAQEAAKAATHFGNTTQAPNLNAQYVIASATGTHPGNFPKGFCGWHSSTSSVDGTLAYTNLPYVPDLGAGACTTLSPATALDGYFSTETHEYAETVTDFFPSAGWLGRGGGEIGDECVNLDRRITLSTGTFDVQGLWSNAANACVTSG